MYGNEQGKKKIVPRSQVTVVSDPIQVPVAGGHATPRLELRRENDQITEIEITCHCGCQMTLICDYQTNAGT